MEDNSEEFQWQDSRDLINIWVYVVEQAKLVGTETRSNAKCVWRFWSGFMWVNTH